MISSLYDLLHHCTVQLRVADGSCGSGFFVAPGQILTCWHVVAGAADQPIQVRWQQQQNFVVASIAQTWPNYDMALLRFAPPQSDLTGADLPWVRFDDQPESLRVGDSLYTFGYPDQEYDNGRPATSEFEGFTGDDPPFLLLKQGQIQPGMSGAPLLNRRTGRVCGMAKFTRDQYSDLGGGGVQGAIILAQVPGLTAQQQAAQPQNQQWETLQRQFLQAQQQANGAMIQSVGLEPDQTRPVIEPWYGREAELGQLGVWQANPGVRLVEITGLGGFGKSSLAAKWLAEVGEGVAQPIWVNFSLGYSFQVFALWLLRQLGQPVDDRTDVDTLMALLVQRLSTRPALVVLDNLETLMADGTTWATYRQWLGRWLEQGTTSQVIITSREQPTLPPNLRRQRCQTLRLKGLSPPAAMELLQSQGVQGTAAELQAFAQLTDGHPLLLNLILGQLWDQYGDEPPLAQWQTLNPDLFAYMGAHRGDPEASVGKVFAASYGRLPSERQQLLRDLCVYRPRFDCQMALAMVTTAVADEAGFEQQVLRQFVRLALLQEVPPAYPQPRRYFLLPLIAQYLRQQGDLTSAHERAAGFYQAIRKPQLSREDEQATVAPYLELAHHLSELGQFDQALSLLKTETDSDNRYSSCETVIAFRGSRATLLPLYRQITVNWQPQTNYEKRRYSDALRAQGDVLQFLKQSSEALENYQQALTIYRQVGDRLGEANTLQAQGDVLQFLKQSSEALENYQQALTIYRQVGDRLGEANTLQAQGDVLQFLDQRSEALENYQQALTIYRQVGDRLGEANTLQAQGDVLQFLDQRSEALENYQQALTIYRQVGARLGEANTLKAQGEVLQFLKQSSEALENYQQALTIYRQVGDRLGEANTLQAQGDVLQFLDQRSEALENYQQALTIYRQVGARLGEANTLKAQGEVLQFLKQSSEALENYQQALTIYRQVGARLGEANTLQAQGDVLQFLKQSSEALENYQQALTIYRQVGDRLGEANTLQAQGDVLQFLKQSSEALENYQQALTIYRQVGARLGEANTLKAQGDVLQFLKQSSEALENYQQALTIYRQVGARLGEANTLKAQGDVLQFLDQRSEALENYQQALTIYRQVGDRLGEANTLKAQGDVLQFLDQRSEALENYQQALTIYRQVGDRLGEANTLKAQGEVLQFLKQSSEALENYQQALTIYRQVGARLGEANTLKAQGRLSWSAQEPTRAISSFEQSLQIYREIGDRWSQANTLQGLANLYQQVGKIREGWAAGQEAQEIFMTLDVPLNSLPYPTWLKKGIKFASQGKWQFALSFCIGLFAFPFALIFIVGITLWRLIYGRFRGRS